MHMYIWNASTLCVTTKICQIQMADGYDSGYGQHMATCPTGKIG